MRSGVLKCEGDNGSRLSGAEIAGPGGRLGKKAGSGIAAATMLGILARLLEMERIDLDRVRARLESIASGVRRRSSP